MNTKYFYIAIFGALGALCRYVLGLLIENHSFPFATLFTNLLGSLLLGILVGYIDTHEKHWTNLMVGLKGGFLGSFTTFSSFCFESIHLSSGESPILAPIYISISLILGMLLAGIGLYWGEKIGKRRARASIC